MILNFYHKMSNQRSYYIRKSPSYLTIVSFMGYKSKKMPTTLCSIIIVKINLHLMNIERPITILSYINT